MFRKTTSNPIIPPWTTIIDDYSMFRCPYPGTPTGMLDIRGTDENGRIPCRGEWFGSPKHPRRASILYGNSTEYSTAWTRSNLHPSTSSVKSDTWVWLHTTPRMLNTIGLVDHILLPLIINIYIIIMCSSSSRNVKSCYFQGN